MQAVAEAKHLAQKYDPGKITKPNKQMVPNKNLTLQYKLPTNAVLDDPELKKDAQPEEVHRRNTTAQKHKSMDATKNNIKTDSTFCT